MDEAFDGFSFPKPMKTLIPIVTIATTMYLCGAKRLLYMTKFMSITGTSLQDFPKTIVGYVMYERAAKPNGAASVIKADTWR